MKFHHFLILFFLLNGCLVNEADGELTITSDESSNYIEPPCSYDDDNAEITNYPLSTDRWYSPDYQDIFSFQRCTFIPIGYSEKFVTQYYGATKFENLYDQRVYDLATSEDEMQLFFRKDSEFSYSAFEGKLYMERISNSWMNFTWCDIKFMDDDGKTLVSSGSFDVRFQQ
jgi:hypothetical protein